MGIQQEPAYIRGTAVGKKLCVSPADGRSDTPIALPMSRGWGVSLVIVRALQRHSLRCAPIAECLLLLIYGYVINKIISSVTKYLKSPSLPPSLSSFSVRSAVKNKESKGRRLTVRKQWLSKFSSIP